jgi:hypothetical protein
MESSVLQAPLPRDLVDVASDDVDGVTDAGEVATDDIEVATDAPDVRTEQPSGTVRHNANVTIPVLVRDGPHGQ